MHGSVFFFFKLNSPRCNPTQANPTYLKGSTQPIRIGLDNFLKKYIYFKLLLYHYLIEH